MAFADAYQNRRILVTGHTGFKGSWLSRWLLDLGAKVTGFALAPECPSLFEQLRLEKEMDHRIGDVRHLESLKKVVQQNEPDFIFHLAAQPLVRLSYAQPVETYETNVMGTVNLLDAVRQAGLPTVVIAVTSDKCYENKERDYSYVEDDPMGGYDPYSSSKGAAELVINAYRRSYFSGMDSGVLLASARAGNVIGGGDWALDRIVPDCMRALRKGEPILVRNKRSTRPWQHVLEPLSGYLWLAARLSQWRAGGNDAAAQRAILASSFNFGPELSSNRTVAELVEEILKHRPGTWEDKSDPNAVHEARLLNLAIGKADRFLNWKPVWDFGESIDQTVAWYHRNQTAPEEIPGFTRGQIEAYTAGARAQNLLWSL